LPHVHALQVAHWSIFMWRIVVATVIEGKKTHDLVSLILAACLFVSPWLFGFADETMPAWNSWIVGIALGILAVALRLALAEWQEWASLALGLWLFASPWVLDFGGNMNALWTHLGLGVLSAALSAWAILDNRNQPGPHA
jgi:hypothetical protein